MTGLIVICTTIVLIILIAGAVSAVERCSYYKWKAANPEAFESDFEEFDESEDEEGN